MSYGLVLDTAIVVLLVATIGWAIALNRKLSHFRKSRPELEALLQRFADTTAQAESGISCLAKEARGAAETLQPRLGEARGLADDLALLVEKGNAVADRLEASISIGRNAPFAAAGHSKTGSVRPGAAPTATDGTKASAQVDQELIKALKSIR